RFRAAADARDAALAGQPLEVTPQRGRRRLHFALEIPARNEAATLDQGEDRLFAFLSVRRPIADFFHGLPSRRGSSAPTGLGPGGAFLCDHRSVTAACIGGAGIGGQAARFAPGCEL